MERLLVFVGSVLVLVSCDWVRTEKSCPMGPGLSYQAFSGEGLSPRTIALVFEGGPGNTTSEIANFLFAQDVPAAFFVQGDQAMTNTKALALLKGRGHLVANGGYSGKTFRAVSEPILEMTRTDEIISPYITGDIFLMGFPHDAFDEALISMLNDAGFRKYVGPIGSDVNVSPEECHATDAVTCAQIYLRAIRLQDHGIVRLRESDREALAVLKTIIPALKDEGFSFVRVDEVPSIRLALEASGAKPGAAPGPVSCNDYE